MFLGLFASHASAHFNTLQSIILRYVYYRWSVLEQIGGCWALRCEQTSCYSSKAFLSILFSYKFYENNQYVCKAQDIRVYTLAVILLGKLHF